MTTPLATAFVLIRPTTTGLGPALKRDLEAQSGVAATAGKKTGSSWAKGFQSSGVTRVANKISEGLVAAGAASVALAVKFQSAMEKIHTQAGVSQKQIGTLGDGILKLAGQVGFSPDSLATSLYHVESAFQSMGITGPKALQLVKIAAEGAAVGGANLEDVTNALTAVISSGIKGAHGFAGAMGVLNATVGVGDMKMQDLAEAFGTGVLAAIKGFGVSIKDAGAALAVFGDNNIRGADAGTALRMSVMALAHPIKAGTTLLESIGIKTNQLADDMQKGGLKLALEDLVGHMRKAGITADQQGAVITTAFGKKAGVGLSVLAGQMTRFESKFPDLAKAAGGFGDAWKRTQATASQQARELGHGFEAMGVTIGQKLLPPLMSMFGFVRTHTGLVIGLGAAIGGVALVISALSLAIRAYEAVTKFAAALNWLFTSSVDAETGAVTGFGLATKIWAGITKVAIAAQWLWNAAMDANPIGAVILAIGLLVAAVVYAYKHFKWFHDGVNAFFTDQAKAAAALWQGLKDGFDAAWHAIKAGMKVFTDITLGFFGTLLQGAANAFGWIPGIGGKLRAASAAFDRFHARVDAALSFQNKTVSVGVNLNVGAGGVRVHAAQGWRVPGYGGGDRWPAMLEGGEAVVPKHLVPAIAPFLSANRVPGFARGGLAGGGLSVHPAFPSVPVMTSAALAVIRGLAQANVSSLFGRLGGGGGAGTARWAPAVLAVLGMLGLPGADLGVVLSQMGTESGGNPSIVNRWDSNWLAGTPSVGLMQVIGPTFAAYAGPFRRTGPFEYGVSVNPLANIYAGLNYALHRYGAGWTSVLGHGHGYDAGGWLPPGLSLAWNGTGRPEQVIAGGGRGGGNRYTIVNNCPPSMNLAEVGRETVRAIREYERRSGKSWRS